MEAGAYVWCRDDDGDEAWLLCEVLKKTNDDIQLKPKTRPDKVITKTIASVNEETGERKFADIELANTPLSEEEKLEQQSLHQATIGDSDADDYVSMPRCPVSHIQSQSTLCLSD